MFIPVRFKTSVQLAPTELTDEFDVVILQKLQKSLEGVCSRHGYIKTNSIEIVKRSMGKLMKQHFNGYIQFSVICRGEVCNPAKDTVVEAKVVNKNALGLLAESYVDDGDVPVLDIIVPKKTAGIVSEINSDDISIGDNIHVMIIGKRFQLNDTKISVIGKVVRNPKDIVSMPIAESDDGTESLDGADNTDIVSEGTDVSELSEDIEGGEVPADDGDDEDIDLLNGRGIFDDDDDYDIEDNEDDDASSEASGEEDALDAAFIE